MDVPLFHIKEKLGAVPSDANRSVIQFRLFIPANVEPHIASIRAAGDFQSQLRGQDWDFDNGLELVKEPAPNWIGDFWTHLIQTELRDGFYEYKYRVTFTTPNPDPNQVQTVDRFTTDPYARYSGQDSQNSAFVIGGSTPEENTLDFMADRKHLKDLVIYELHIGDFTQGFRGEDAPLDAVKLKLDYLKDLGINAILFEPWTAWKNKEYDWGYSPFQYFAVEYAYANDAKKPTEKLSKLKSLIKACHEKGIHVIMDGVFNHCDPSFPYNAFYLDPSKSPYTNEKFGGEFSGLQDLDYYNYCTRAFIRDVCLYWIDEFKIDGIRFDNTVNFYIRGDQRGLPNLLDSITKFVASRNQRNFSLTLEHLREDATYVINHTAATSYWDNGLFGKCFQQLWDKRLPGDYLNVLNNARFLTDETKRPTSYLSNHDHSTVAYQAGARDNSKNASEWFRTQPHVIALFTTSGVPMIAMGQEFATYYYLPDDNPGRVVPHPLQWGNETSDYGGKLLSLYKTMIAMRNKYPALRSKNFYPAEWPLPNGQQADRGFGVDVDRGIMVYRRWERPAEGGNTTEYFYVGLNFTDQKQDVEIAFERDGVWTDLISGTTINVDGGRRIVTLESNWGHVFYHKLD